MNKSPTNRFQNVLVALLLSTAFLPAHAAIVYVDMTAMGANDGSSWTDAYNDLQSAFGSAAPNDSICVAAGTYKPTAGAARDYTFQLLSGVAIYGGFAGDETDLSERDWTANVTVLSGDIGVVDVDTDNSYQVVTGSGTDSTAVLDGFTITKGYANGSGAGNGGGLYNVAGSPTIVNVVFSYNYAHNWGGGMYNDNSSPTLINVSFSENRSTTGGTEGYGGGMCNEMDSNPILINTILWGNYAWIAGDQIYNDASTPEISYSLIEDSGGSGAGWDTSLGTDGGGNLDADPLFADGPGGDLRLLADSPAIDAGDNAAPNLPDADLDGNLRIVGVTVDMGPYEYQSAVGVPDADMPSAMQFVSAAPNPFNPKITIVFEVTREQDLTVVVYDLLGRCVRTLARGNRVAGRHEVLWNGRDTQNRAVASGTYIIRLEAESGVEARKIALVR